ncbi:MAG: 2OG-Fe(II) oxygenase [Panacagrimonas sp.]
MSTPDLRSYIRVYDHDLDREMCARLVASFAALSRFHQPNGRGHKAALDQSAWTELNVTRLSDPAFLGYFRKRIDEGLSRYNRDVPLPLPIPNSPKTADLILKRYRPVAGDSFQVHFDAVHEVSNRYLVFLWYLNDVASGGETEFPGLDLRIEAREGRLLMFPPYWMFAHAGLEPASGDKYILSTYLLF